jgi:probable rRNA maturation factor
MSLQSDISVECELWSKLADLDALVEHALQAARLEAGKTLFNGAEVSLLFCDDGRIQELNRDWRGLDKPTNVLSFPAAPADRLASAPLLGDIAIAFETVTKEARDEDKTLFDHTSHMIVHGFLHLLGYDHENEKEAEEMEDLERRALARLGIADPYAASELVNGKKAP